MKHSFDDYSDHQYGYQDDSTSDYKFHKYNVMG